MEEHTAIIHPLILQTEIVPSGEGTTRQYSKTGIGGLFVELDIRDMDNVFMVGIG